MALGTIEITTEEYKELVNLKGRVEAFEDFARHKADFITVKDCALILGFELHRNVGVNKNAGTD